MFHSKYSFSCSFFYDSSLDLCFTEMFLKVKNATEPAAPIWNLGSLLCQSSYGKVCDLLAHATDAKDKCSVVGCGNQLHDLYTGKCAPIPKSAFTENESRMDGRSQPYVPQWPAAQICNYYSRCAAVNLGLIEAHELNCHCDKFCIYYNDCCKDSPYQATESTRLSPDSFSCYSTRLRNIENKQELGTFMIDSCPSEQNSPLCAPRELYGDDWTDLRSIYPYVPVTDTHTGLV